MRLLRRGRSERKGLPRLWGRGAIAQGTVWSDRVEVLPPPFDERLGVKQRVKRFPFQQFVNRPTLAEVPLTGLSLGRMMFMQFASLGAGENGGRFTVKKYHSKKTVTADGWRHSSIQLLPLNPSFEPITLEPEAADDLFVVGELVQCLV